MDCDPKLIRSSYSGPITEQGVTVRVEIYRLENDPKWVLEVVNENGTSTVWDELFNTDRAAHEAFQLAVEEEGMVAFLDDTDVVPSSIRH